MSTLAFYTLQSFLQMTMLYDRLSARFVSGLVLGESWLNATSPSPEIKRLENSVKPSVIFWSAVCLGFLCSLSSSNLCMRLSYRLTTAHLSCLHTGESGLRYTLGVAGRIMAGYYQNRLSSSISEYAFHLSAIAINWNIKRYLWRVLSSMWCLAVHGPHPF